MARRIRWQILIAAMSSILVFGLMGYLALTTAAVAQPLAGGAYVEGIVGPPQQLNPLVSDAIRDPAGADIQALVFEGLMRIGVDGLPEPALAQSWQIDDTGTVYTFTLRADVAWHDGAPLTADDALFTLRAIQNRWFSGDPAMAEIWRNVLVDKIDSRSIRCTLSAPFAPFLSRATFPILPAHLLRDVAPDQWSSAPFGRTPVGAGPYQLVELTPERARLTANARYYGGRPFLDSIELRFFSNPQAALAALNRGEINGLGYLGVSELGGVNLPRAIVPHTIPLDSYAVLTFNVRQEPLTDIGLRRALALGLDKNALISRVLDGRAVRLDTPILPGWWAASADAGGRPVDLTRAADTLASLGYLPGADGVRVREGRLLALPLITDDAPDRVAVAQEIARQWAALGVRVEVQQLDGEALKRRLVAHDFMLALHGWARLGPDPDVYALWHSSQAVRGENYAGLQDDEIDDLLASAQQDLDIAARAASYAAFQRRWDELAPSIPLYQPLFIYASTDQLGGLGLGQDADVPGVIASSQLLLGRENRFRNVTNWFLRSAREIRGELR